MPSIVSDVKQFTAKANVMGLKISYMSADIKNFFSDIRKTPLLEKFDFDTTPTSFLFPSTIATNIFPHARSSRLILATYFLTFANFVT